VLDRLVGSIIDIGIGVKIINGMTLGGEKEPTMLIKRRWVLGLFYEA
jgi:hypothetical protein